MSFHSVPVFWLFCGWSLPRPPHTFSLLLFFGRPVVQILNIRVVFETSYITSSIFHLSVFFSLLSGICSQLYHPSHIKNFFTVLLILIPRALFLFFNFFITAYDLVYFSCFSLCLFWSLSCIFKDFLDI